MENLSPVLGSVALSDIVYFHCAGHEEACRGAVVACEGCDQLHFQHAPAEMYTENTQ